MRTASLLWWLLAAVLEFPELGVFGKDVKSPYRGDQQTTHAFSPSPFEEKHATEARHGMQHQRANPDPRCPTLVQVARHDGGIGIDLAQVMRDVFIAAVTNFDIEVVHTPCDADALVQGVTTPLAALT